MESSEEKVFLATSIASLSLVALASIPTALSIARRLNGQFRSSSRNALISTTESVVYVDEDGEATKDSVEVFSGKWQRISAILLSFAGLGASVSQTLLVGETDNRIPFILQDSIWVLLSVQAATLSLEPWPTRRFRLSQYAYWTSILAMVIPGLGIGLEWRKSDWFDYMSLSSRLQAAQLAAASLQAVCCSCLPRRPDVFHNGRLVDKQYTVSILSRFTFSWANGLLQYATHNRNLGINDLPELPFSARSDVLLKRLEQKRTGSRKLWRVLLAGHLWSIVFQLLLGIVSCLLSFGPQIALYAILKSLEQRQGPAWDAAESWIWVLVLGVLMLLCAAVESWLSWIIYADIGIPIHEELTAMVFGKCMRLKDTGHTTQGTSSQVSTGKEKEDRQLKDGQRSILNLAAVDARRIADFASAHYLIPTYLLKLVVACILLVELIGWESLVAGLSVAALVTPINTFLTRRMGRIQGNLMRATDSRVAVLTECLQGIRQVKFCALEEQWQARIAERRETELRWLWTSMLYRVGLISLWIFFPLILSAISLTVYSLIHNELTPSVAFTAMSVFGGLEAALASLPDLLAKGVEAQVSARRIDDFMSSSVETVSNATAGNTISFTRATLAWPAQKHHQRQQESFLLRDLNLTFPAGGLSLIAGRTGSGKSLLLASILGDCDVAAGLVNVPMAPPAAERYDHLATPADWIIDSALACVTQTPWIENATIRDNILLGLPHHPSRYHNVLFASGLDPDLAVLPDGDLTDIGANGVNLSGGQRWRVALARALYSRAGILVVDDIFSALDAHTGRHVYEHGLAGELAKGRTRVLATHHVGLCLPRSDYCVLLDGGCVRWAGAVDDVARADVLSQLAIPQEGERAVGHGKVEEEGGLSSRPRHAPGEGAALATLSSKKFVQEEGRATGSTPLSLYTSYFRSSKRLLPWALAFVAFLVYIALLLGRSLWMSVWTGAADPHHTPENQALLVSNQHFHTPPTSTMNSPIFHAVDGDLALYIGVYVGISVAACVIGAMRMLLLLFAAIESSRNLFNDLLFTILRAPMRWLDTCPQGRILNRFLADMSLLDGRLGYNLGLFLGRSLEIVGIAVTSALVCSPLLATAVVLLGVCVRLAHTYLAGARELKRLENTSKSPIFEQFGSCIRGLTTIRAFGRIDEYIRIMHGRINDHARASWNLWLLNSWLTLRLSLVVAVFSTFTAAVVVYMESVPASLAGLILSLVLRYSYIIAMAVKQYSNVEMDMCAAERVIEYANIETEDQGGREVPAAWPTEGRLEVHDLVAGYSPELPPSLDGLTFAIEPNQRVGVVGRTGAGKSSLALALFRFLEARQGQIYIDGVDVSQIRLRDLRSRLAIIPQDPVLFSGTVRSNLDPFGEYGDVELYQALEGVNLVRSDTALKAAASGSGERQDNVFPSLTSSVAAGGLNLSQGQRQLLCLARAVLSRPKILVMDEATSAVDMETDTLIQQSLRSEFGRNATTLLVIAHRLSTVADFDRILVVEAGKLVEFDSPRELMSIPGGVFRGLVENSGERDLLERVILGETSTQ